MRRRRTRRRKARRVSHGPDMGVVIGVSICMLFLIAVVGIGALWAHGTGTRQSRTAVAK